MASDHDRVSNCGPSESIALTFPSCRSQKLIMRKQKKAEKDARLIKELSTVIAFNPYEYRVGSTGNTTAWKRVFGTLIQDNVLDNTIEARKRLMRDVLGCVREYKMNFMISERNSGRNRELTEIERLAKEIYHLQANGAPPTGRALRKKWQEEHSGDDVAVDVLVEVCHRAASEDAEESKDEVPAEEIASDLLVVPCPSNEETEKIPAVLPFFSSGVKKLPIPRAASGIPIPTGVQYIFLCPTPVNTLVQEQANLSAPTRVAAAERCEETGRRWNCEVASESDEGAAVEDDRQECDNGLPTAVGRLSGLPTMMNQKKRFLSEEAKENICEYISCSTCGVSQEPCWKHAQFIKDKHSSPLALSSLPKALKFRTDRKTGIPLRVLSRVSLSSHTVFGPMRGALCSHISTRFVISDATSRKCYHLDSDDTCNWMKYVRFADSAGEQNLAVFIKENRIFFVTTREVKAKEELKVWYSRKYADSLRSVNYDVLRSTRDVDERLRGVDSEKNVKDDESVAFPEIDQNEFPVLEFQENILPGVEDGPRSLTAGSIDGVVSSQQSRRGRMDPARSLSETDQETMDVSSAGQLMNFPSQSASDVAPLGDIVKNSSEVFSDDPEPSEQIPQSKRKKQKKGSLKKKQPKYTSLTIKFPCAECGIHFPTEAILVLHNYQHSGDVDSEERTCPECGVISENLGDLSIHVKEHGKKYYPREKCLHCDALIANWAMNGHTRHYHPEKFDPITGSYPCKKCGMKFVTFTARSKHVTASHGIPLECVFCGTIAPSAVTLGRHVLVHKEEDGFRCPKCQKTFASYPVLRFHHDRHCNAKERKKWKNIGLPRIKKNNQKVSKFRIDPSTKIKFPCIICRKYYKMEALLEVHRRFHETESDKSYRGDDIEKACPDCGEEFDTLDALFRHVEGHGVNFYEKEQCQICKKFITAHLMARHMAGNHPGGEAENGEKYPCEVCKKVFPSKMKHQAHLQVHKHKKCLLCAEIFERWKDLGQHALNTHKEADGFHCPYCDGVFDTFRHLTSHHRNRHDIRSIMSCEQCGKICQNSSKLHLHMDIDHGSNEFDRKCDLCGKMFRRQSTLRNHVACMHTARGRKKVQDYQEQLIKRGYVAPKKRMLLGEFPFKCEACQVGFLYEGRMLRHLDRFHPDES